MTPLNAIPICLLPLHELIIYCVTFGNLQTYQGPLQPRISFLFGNIENIKEEHWSKSG